MRLYMIQDRETFMRNVVGFAREHKPKIAQVVFDAEFMMGGTAFTGFGIEFVRDFKQCYVCNKNVIDMVEDMTRYEFSAVLVSQEPFRLRSRIEHEIKTVADAEGWEAPAFNINAFANMHPLTTNVSLLGRWTCQYGTDMQVRCMHCDAVHRNSSFTVHHEKRDKSIVRRDALPTSEFVPNKLEFAADIFGKDNIVTKDGEA